VGAAIHEGAFLRLTIHKIGSGRPLGFAVDFAVPIWPEGATLPPFPYEIRPDGAALGPWWRAVTAANPRARRRLPATAAVPTESRRNKRDHAHE